jgi:hypothetical protein
MRESRQRLGLTHSVSEEAIQLCALSEHAVRESRKLIRRSDSVIRSINRVFPGGNPASNGKS